jgi:hypothetical protein
MLNDFFIRRDYICCPHFFIKALSILILKNSFSFLKKIDLQTKANEIKANTYKKEYIFNLKEKNKEKTFE